MTTNHPDPAGIHSADDFEELRDRLAVAIAGGLAANPTVNSPSPEYVYALADRILASESRKAHR